LRCARHLCIARHFSVNFRSCDVHRPCASHAVPSTVDGCCLPVRMRANKKIVFVFVFCRFDCLCVHFLFCLRFCFVVCVHVCVGVVYICCLFLFVLFTDLRTSGPEVFGFADLGSTKDFVFISDFKSPVMKTSGLEVVRFVDLVSNIKNKNNFQYKIHGCRFLSSSARAYQEEHFVLLFLLHRSEDLRT
jgi:hypothetical protein